LERKEQMRKKKAEEQLKELNRVLNLPEEKA
jgi:hypothetical protein